MIEFARVGQAVVRDRHAQSLAFDASLHGDLPVGRRVSRRVLDQVGQGD